MDHVWTVEPIFTGQDKSFRSGLSVQKMSVEGGSIYLFFEWRPVSEGSANYREYVLAATQFVPILSIGDQ